jgi:2-keto-4-pentenoate hydratase
LTSGDDIEALARDLARARAGGGLLAAPDLDAASALAVQRAAIPASGPLAGWKIGATGAAAQASFGTDRPFYGPIPAAAAVASGGVVPWAEGMRGAECEIAFRLGRVIGAGEGLLGEEEVASRVGEVAIALELVASRWQPGPKLTVHHAIADFGFNGGFVLGPRIPGWRGIELAGIAARCLVDGEEKGSGTAQVVYGGPLKALTWLANNGPTLEPGMWVSTGTITGLAPVRPGSRIVGDFGEHGRVEATIAG